MKSLFSESATEEILNRLDQLSPNAERAWGKMSVEQMLSHCQGPLEVSMGTKPLKKPNAFIALLMKSFKKTMYNDIPWKKGVPTAKEFIVTSEKDFMVEKDKLTALITTFKKDEANAPWVVHPVFGAFTKEQWGQLNYKHLDHHLRQFGA